MVGGISQLEDDLARGSRRAGAFAPQRSAPPPLPTPLSISLRIQVQLVIYDLGRCPLIIFCSRGTPLNEPVANQFPPNLAVRASFRAFKGMREMTLREGGGVQEQSRLRAPLLPRFQHQPSPLKLVGKYWLETDWEIRIFPNHFPPNTHLCYAYFSTSLYKIYR